MTARPLGWVVECSECGKRSVVFWRIGDVDSLEGGETVAECQRCGIVWTLSEWEHDCMRWRGTILVGDRAHWCGDWDGLPVDETTPEFASCTCYAPGQT